MVHKLRERPAPSTHPLEDHPDYVNAIGMVSLETIALEIRLANLLARMIGVPLRIGQAIYLSPKSEQSRLDILRHTAHSRLAVSPSKKGTMLGRQQTKALDDVISIANRAQALIGDRHRVIHDEWNYSDKEKKITRKRVDGKPGNPRKPTPKTEIESLITKIRSLIDDAYSLANSFRENPPFIYNLKSDPTN
jgi:hypothetical protein